MRDSRFVLSDDAILNPPSFSKLLSTANRKLLDGTTPFSLRQRRGNQVHCRSVEARYLLASFIAHERNTRSRNQF
ncbi:hypothetical protein Lalb_Chr02g0153361 [Lupinus albus]|uniref:Uncharacterized protein n=1 Tax=Lupinus albus TaxID=3870 RepID=A0A6A4R1H7_LUPAL|nr:hypothetical protein Lalb_Chr02g0153361 [Lupinus albus]